MPKRDEREPASAQVFPAEVALPLIRRARKHGGFGRLVGTGLLVPTTLGALGLVAVSPIAALVSLAAGALLVRNVIQNQRTLRWQENLTALAALPPPYVAVLVDDELRIGTHETPQGHWCRFRLTAAQLRELRVLALPPARVVVRDD